MAAKDAASEPNPVAKASATNPPRAVDVLPYCSANVTSLLLLMATPGVSVPPHILYMRRERLFGRVGLFLVRDGQARLTSRWWATQGVTKEIPFLDALPPIRDGCSPPTVRWTKEIAEKMLAVFNDRRLPPGCTTSPVAIVRVVDMIVPRGKGVLTQCLPGRTIDSEHGRLIGHA